MHRTIWKNAYGPIPKDEYGRSYEVHHKDGNHQNNNIDNLMLVTINEHYKIHHEQGDFGACVLIAKRMNMTPEEISNIQKGVKRPGIGGRKKGSIPWNKGKKDAFSDETKQKWSQTRKGKIWKPVKLNQTIINNIIEEYFKNKPLDGVGQIQQNGKKLSYLWAFCKDQAPKYNVTPQAIKRMLLKNVQTK